jgi:hypothetical protein
VLTEDFVRRKEGTAQGTVSFSPNKHVVRISYTIQFDSVNSFYQQADFIFSHPSPSPARLRLSACSGRTPCTSQAPHRSRSTQRRRRPRNPPPPCIRSMGRSSSRRRTGRNTTRLSASGSPRSRTAPPAQPPLAEDRRHRGCAGRRTEADGGAGGHAAGRARPAREGHPADGVQGAARFRGLPPRLLSRLAHASTAARSSQWPCCGRYASWPRATAACTVWRDTPARAAAWAGVTRAGWSVITHRQGCDAIRRLAPAGGRVLADLERL